MAIDRKHVGKRYGPFRYAVGEEEIADYAIAVAGGVPGRAFPASGERLASHPWYLDGPAARASPHGGAVAPPMFAASFAIQPFALACCDPDLGLDLVRLVHGEQEFAWRDAIRPGDVLETVGEIADAFAKGSLDFLVVKTTSRNQHGRVVVEGTWTAIVRS